MITTVEDGKAIAVRGNPDHPVNLGKLCPKGLSEHHTLAATNRAQYPMLKRHGRLERVSWDEALRTMAARFLEVQVRHGREAVGVISTGQLVTEEFYTLGKLVQLGLGTSNYDGNTTLCMSTAVAGYKRSFGSDGPPPTMAIAPSRAGAFRKRYAFDLMGVQRRQDIAGPQSEIFYQRDDVMAMELLLKLCSDSG